MKKIIDLLIIAFALLGIIGGIGYTIYCAAYPISVGLLIAGYLAWPEFKKTYEDLIA